MPTAVLCYERRSGGRVAWSAAPDVSRLSRRGGVFESVQIEIDRSILDDRDFDDLVEVACRKLQMLLLSIGK